MSKTAKSSLFWVRGTRNFKHSPMQHAALRVGHTVAVHVHSCIHTRGQPSLPHGQAYRGIVSNYLESCPRCSGGLRASFLTDHLRRQIMIRSDQITRFQIMLNRTWAVRQDQWSETDHRENQRPPVFSYLYKVEERKERKKWNTAMCVCLSVFIQLCEEMIQGVIGLWYGREEEREHYTRFVCPSLVFYPVICKGVNTWRVMIWGTGRSGKGKEWRRGNVLFSSKASQGK